MVISELCSADHRRRSRSLTAALRPSADVAALLRTRTPVGASSFGGVCHQLEVMRLSRVSDKRRFSSFFMECSVSSWHCNDFAWGATDAETSGMLVGGHTLHDRADNFMSGDRILPIGVELLRTHRGSGMMPGSLLRLDRGKLQYPMC